MDLWRVNTSEVVSDLYLAEIETHDLKKLVEVRVIQIPDFERN